MKTFKIFTNCCAVQRSETYRIASFFKRNGYVETKHINEAEILVITTCGVTQDCENESIDIIKQVLVGAKDNSIIIVSGCLPNIDKKAIEEIGDKRIIYIPFTQMPLFNKVIECTVKIDDVVYNTLSDVHISDGDPKAVNDDYSNEEALSLWFSNHYHDNRFYDSFKYTTRGKYLWRDKDLFEVKVSSGCAFNCSYCASRIGIGEYVSKSLDKIIEEVKKGINKGYQKIMLMGDEIGKYGCDINANFEILLDCIFRLSGQFQLGIRYIHPDMLLKYQDSITANISKIFFICVSLQTGSGKNLFQMNRDDNIDRVLLVLKELKQRNPFCFIHTQIMVGFPNETDDDYNCTKNLIAGFDFDFVRINKFSPRKCTAAFFMDNQVDEAIKQARFNDLQLLCDRRREQVIAKRYLSLLKINEGT